MIDGETRWFRIPQQELVWRVLGTSVLAFQPASGRTHFFNELAAKILASVTAQPLGLKEICAELCAEFGGESTLELEQAALQTLKVFEHHGIVEPVLHT